MVVKARINLTELVNIPNIYIIRTVLRNVDGSSISSLLVPSFAKKVGGSRQTLA